MNGLIIVFVFREEWGTAPGGGGALPYKPIRDAPFFGVSFLQRKFLNGV